MSRKRFAVAFAACLLASSLTVVGSAPAEPKEDCTWGASSVSVEQANGQHVQSGPFTTGCIPTSP
jgi:hypothetical protein